MATIVLSAAGSALGSAIGGSVAGLSTAVIGRAVGATVGRLIDQKLMGQGSRTVETGRVDRFLYVAPNYFSSSFSKLRILVPVADVSALPVLSCTVTLLTLAFGSALTITR